MVKVTDIQAIAEEARRKGFFDPDEYAGLTLTGAQFGELWSYLSKHGIPFGRPAQSIDRRQALRIINALRKGIPPSDGVMAYSVGREDLLDTLREDLGAVSTGRSRVRFMNADVGLGKTHALHLLREVAFLEGFVVSLVTLRQSSCPLHEFMGVYSEVMWGIRTAEERHRSALENVLDKWMIKVREMGFERAQQIVYSLPGDIKGVLASYAEAVSLFRPNESKRQAILRYLSGQRTTKTALRRLKIPAPIDESNALHMLGKMASLFRHLRYKGVCILFDEAESLHSFAYSARRDRAYGNLLKIIRESHHFPHCYFLYATTPSFFDSYAHYWPHDHRIGSSQVLELDPVPTEDIQELTQKICAIYRIAYDWQPGQDIQAALMAIGDRMGHDKVGDIVRTTVALLDERARNVRAE